MRKEILVFCKIVVNGQIDLCNKQFDQITCTLLVENKSIP